MHSFTKLNINNVTRTYSDTIATQISERLQEWKEEYDSWLHTTNQEEDEDEDDAPAAPASSSPPPTAAEEEDEEMADDDEGESEIEQVENKKGATKRYVLVYRRKSV